MPMRRFLTAIIASSLFLATAALAQYYDRPYGDRDYARRDRALFDHVRMDLDRAANYPYASRPDRKRFDQARRELFDFESRFDQGRYDKHELSEAINKIENVISHNSLDARDRGALAEDVRRMRDYRDFRAHHENRDFDSAYRPY
jgi:hypothetical protein